MTEISESLHSRGCVVEADESARCGRADLLGVGVLVAFFVDECDGDGDGEATGAVGEVAGPAAADGVPSPPRPLTSQTAATTTPMTTTRARARRTQYTLGGCGPTGRIMLLTGATLPAPPRPAASARAVPPDNVCAWTQT